MLRIAFAKIAKSVGKILIFLLSLSHLYKRVCLSLPHSAFPNPFKKYDETTLQFCLTRPPSCVGHAAKISRKKSNSKLINLPRNLDDALPNPFKKYDETTFQFGLTRPPSVVGHAAKIRRKKSNSKLIDFQRNLDDGCKNKIFKLLMRALNQ